MERLRRCRGAAWCVAPACAPKGLGPCAVCRDPILNGCRATARAGGFARVGQALGGLPESGPSKGCWWSPRAPGAASTSRVAQAYLREYPPVKLRKFGVLAEYAQYYTDCAYCATDAKEDKLLASL